MDVQVVIDFRSINNRGFEYVRLGTSLGIASST